MNEFYKEKYNIAKKEIEKYFKDNKYELLRIQESNMLCYHFALNFSIGKKNFVNKKIEKIMTFYLFFTLKELSLNSLKFKELVLKKLKNNNLFLDNS